MSANKCCCCRLLSCFACFSDKKTAKPDSSEIAPSSLNVVANASPAAALKVESSEITPFALNVIANASPAATLTVESSHVISSATAASPANASDDILGHDSQPRFPSVASSSQTNASKDVIVMQNDSQPIAPSAVPSSSQPTLTSFASPTSSQTIVSPLAHPAHDKGFQVGSSSNPSPSSVPKESDHAKNIREAAGAIDIENADADLNDLINYISQLLDFIKEKKTRNKQSKPKADKDYWPASNSFIKLKELLCEGINVVKDVLPGDTKTIVRGFLDGMGMAHMVTTGFLVVADILERYETLSTNQEACLSLLKEMNILAQHVKKLKERPGLKEGMEAAIKEATVLIVEASIVCCTQIDASKFSKFFSTSMDKEAVVKFQNSLTETYTKMQSQMDLCLYDAIVRPRKPRELQYPQYPKDAVGIEKPLKEVIELLEWGSNKNAVAIILHGFGGMGKTTLADAVFARVFDENIEGCKYSFVRLFDNITSTPDIIKLQTCILKDLMMVEEPEIPEIRRYEEGQIQIEDMLEKEAAFIYIDNVLDRDQLDHLLPRDMAKAKKLRLLVTAREKDVLRVCTMKREVYAMKPLPDIEAMSLLKEKICTDNKDGTEKQINSSQLDDIIRICGGVPKLLEVVAGYISSEEDKQKAYVTVMEEKEKNWKDEGDIGKDIARYVFAYENLAETLKDPFLDICSFFHGWDWEAVANIVGEFALNQLEKRALVTKHTNMTARIHDIILKIGKQKTEGLRFTGAKQIQDCLCQMEDEDIRRIKGIWLNEDHSPLSIPASKLDLMYSSLRVLRLGALQEVHGECKKIFDKLIFFQAEISHLPFDVSKFKELRHLCYKPEHLSILSQMPSNLRHIEFEVDRKCINPHDFEISSNCLRQSRNLRVLRLRFAQLKKLPQELGDLVNGLQELDLSSCQYLEELPASISKLRSLRVLRMESCFGLRHLSNEFGSLDSLQELRLGSCESLKALPSSLEKLILLQELHLGGCTSLEALPSSLEKLSSLRLLDLSSCESLKDLPYGVGKLTSLVKLCLACCNKLSSIPESIGQLKLLDSSMSFSLTGLKELPDGFCNLSFITNLDMEACHSLEKLPDRFGEVASLRNLNLRYCWSLKKLPESFSKLKYLEHLDLSQCTTLEELCINFKDLSSLRVLSLDFCQMLKKLPEDFHCLVSLEVLDLRNCPMLEGKWMESMVKIKTIQIVNIKGSPLLEERWGEIQRQCDQSWSFAVYTGQGSSNEERKESLLRKLQSEFDSILTNGREEPFHISDLPLNTLLLVMFDGRQEFDHGFPFSLIEENIDDIQTNFEIIYFGNHFNKLPKKLTDRIVGHAPDKSNARALFDKVFAVADLNQEAWISTFFQMSVKIVKDEKGDKYLSCWEWLSRESVEEFVIKKCGRYLKLKQLVEKAGQSNIELLRELFASEEESCHGFLKNDASAKVGVDELKGKTILLDIRPANMCYDTPLQSLMEMYVEEKERFDFEIITIPIMQENTKLDVSEKFSREVPWLVLQNPWQLTNATKYFLVEGCARWPQAWDKWYPNIMRIIESNGTLAAHNSPGVLRMVNTWGAEAYPFTEEKSKELKEKEVNQMKAMSNLMFLFTNLESVSEQVKEALHQRKMIFIYSSSEEEFTSSIRNALIELSDRVYIIYIPQFGHEEPELTHFTAAISKDYWPLEKSKMPQVEIQGISLLKLSEHEAMKFWVRIYSLIEAINGIEDDDEQFNRMKKLLSCASLMRCFWYSWMIIMDEDGKLITTKGREILKLLCKENSNDKAKELMQHFIKGTKESRKETLVELEQLLS